MASAADSNKIRTYYPQPTVVEIVTFSMEAQMMVISVVVISVLTGFKSMYNREDV